MTAKVDPGFPYSLVIHIPFPTHRLARSALRTLAVDEELSKLVKREFTLISSVSARSSVVLRGPLEDCNEATSKHTNNPDLALAASDVVSALAEAPLEPKDVDESLTVLRAEYRATTNRMLRVAVNGFFESLGVIVQVMEELDTDVLHEKGIEGLEGVQGIEQGLTGETITGA